jgi:hypothetical protein
VYSILAVVKRGGGVGRMRTNKQKREEELLGVPAMNLNIVTIFLGRGEKKNRRSENIFGSSDAIQ